MIFHEVVINKYICNEAYRNVSGYELVVRRNSENVGSWISEENLQDDYRQALQLMDRLAYFIKERENFSTIENPKKSIKLVIDYYQIGD